MCYTELNKTQKAIEILNKCVELAPKHSNAYVALSFAYLKENNLPKTKEFLLQCMPDVKSMIGNAKLIGGHIDHDCNPDKIFKFITTKGIFLYNEATDEFKSKLQIR